MLAPPEYVIVRKLEYDREGGSEKHLRDIRSRLAVSGGQMDRPALEQWIERRGLQNQWRLVSTSAAHASSPPAGRPCPGVKGLQRTNLQSDPLLGTRNSIRSQPPHKLPG